MTTKQTEVQLKQTEVDSAARAAAMAEVREMVAAERPKYHIVTLGCQMNVRDSESLAGMLETMGYRPAEAKEDADLVLYNTCCVRENAENRALGNVIWLKELKKVKPNLLICVGGCMMQEAGMADKLRAAYPFIDIVFGTHNMDRFPLLLKRALTERRPVYEVYDRDGAIVEGLPVVRQNAVSAFLTVMYGCNNFCSYCIVPYVRGRERSRREEDILAEARSLRKQGVQEVTLLGQNVNSYGGGGARFAELLRKIDEVGIPRLRFMTSHPKDVSPELIAAFRECRHLMPQLHLPVQSGNDRILGEMNRRYTRGRYLELVARLREALPDIGLTSDIIVGFPGETEAEFEDTLSLVEQVRFDAAYTFIYSPREGTRAAQMPDDTPYALKSARIQRLIAAQQRITSEILARQIGTTQRVLVESASTRDAGQMSGKTERGHMVNFPGNIDLAGQIVAIRIESAGKNTLRGQIREGILV